MYNFKYDGSKFKLQIKNERYFVNKEKRTVTVTADVMIVVPDFIVNTIHSDQLPKGFVGAEDWFGFGMPVKMTKTARCSEEDTWDEEKGRKIALAKLEAKAYNRFSKSLDNWYVRFANDFIANLQKMGVEFLDKAANAASHDEKYIYDIA